MIYLAGPMEGVDYVQMNEWRRRAKLFFTGKGIPSLDPCRRKKFHDQEPSMNLSRRIVAQDHQDILASNLVFLNLSALNGAKAWGSVCELAFANANGIPVITIIDEGYHHPFIEALSTEIHHDLVEALEAAHGYFT